MRKRKFTQNFGGKTDGYIECGKVRGFRMCENIRDPVRDYHLLKKDAASWSSQQSTTQFGKLKGDVLCSVTTARLCAF